MKHLPITWNVALAINWIVILALKYKYKKNYNNKKTKATKNKLNWKYKQLPL